MIYLELFFTFFKLGSFAFGGAYGAIPLFREEVLAHGWMTDSMFTNVVAISESTPGPIMINAATYIGSQQTGFLGVVLANLGVIFPSFIIVLLVTILFKSFLNNPKIQGILKGIKQCIMGLILSTGVFIGYQTVFGDLKNISVDYTATSILIAVLAVLYLSKKLFKKEISPILIIVISAVLGGILYY